MLIVVCMYRLVKISIKWSETAQKNALANVDIIVTQLLRYHMPLLYFVCNHLIYMASDIFNIKSANCTHKMLAILWYLCKIWTFSSFCTYTFGSVVTQLFPFTLMVQIIITEMEAFPLVTLQWWIQNFP